MNMVEANGLVVEFRRGRSSVRAVDGVDLSVREGEIVGFLGPNGAGKTTTLRVLTTLLSASAGTATVAGHDVTTQAQAVRRAIGYVSQAGGTASAARAGDEVTDHAQLYGLDRATAVRRGRELFSQLDLEGLWDRTPRRMSGGQKRRLDIVMGLIHDPSLVFLDEPTTGLDPQARANLWEHVRRLRSERGVTVFLTTHYLDEADALADRIIVIDHGRIVADDTSAHLKAGISGDLVALEVEPSSVGVARRHLERVASSVEVSANQVRGRVPGAGRVVPSLLSQLASDGVALHSIEVIRPTLDDVFLSLTGRSLRDDAPVPELEGVSA